MSCLHDFPNSPKEAIKQGLKYYFTGKPCKHGHISLRYSSRNCIECIKENAKVYRKKKSTKRVNAKRARRWAKNNPKPVMLQAAKQRAKKYNLEFNIDLEDINIPKICPVLNIPLKRGSGGWADGSPTLDRIDSTKGYIKGNVHVISWKANRLKSNGTLEDFAKIVDYLKSIRDNRN